MTDEEMTDEYVKKEGFRIGLDDITSSEANKEIKQAFLAGLKAKEKENAKLKKLLHAYFMYFMSAQNGYYLKDIDEKEVKKLLGVDKIM